LRRDFEEDNRIILLAVVQVEVVDALIGRLLTRGWGLSMSSGFSSNKMLNCFLLIFYFGFSVDSGSPVKRRRCQKKVREVEGRHLPLRRSARIQVLKEAIFESTKSHVIETGQASSPATEKIGRGNEEAVTTNLLKQERKDFQRGKTLSPLISFVRMLS